VEAVEPGGPAETAGFERLDLILALGGTPLRRGEALADALLPHRPGDRIRVGLVRRGERVEATVLLAARLEER
jgi:S1-C subfamily serine protease